MTHNLTRLHFLRAAPRNHHRSPFPPCSLPREGSIPLCRSLENKRAQFVVTGPRPHDTSVCLCRRSVRHQRHVGHHTTSGVDAHGLRVLPWSLHATSSPTGQLPERRQVLLLAEDACLTAMFLTLQADQYPSVTTREETPEPSRQMTLSSFSDSFSPLDGTGWPLTHGPFSPSSPYLHNELPSSSVPPDARAGWDLEDLSFRQYSPCTRLG